VIGAAQRRVLFVADAFPAAGLGHVVRSTALAAALGRVGVSSVFLVNPHPSVLEKLGRAGSALADEAHDWDGQIHPDVLARVARQSGCSVVVVDSYRADDHAFATLRAAGLFVVAIDDLAREPCSCHLVVNGGAHAPALRYRSSSGDTLFLLGSEYALIRQELWEPPVRQCRARVQRVLVTLGGGASTDLVGDVLGRLDRVSDEFDVTVIQGPFSGSWPGPASAPCSPAKRNIRIVTDPPAVLDLMRDADIAVCGGGQTLYELAALGTPAVVLQLAANQADSLRAVVASGAARLADADSALASVEQIVHELCEYADRRAAMSEAGQRLVDGRGAIRVARALLDHLAVVADCTTVGAGRRPLA
jgi:spore coat polysaccharide biosynthesis predicted glycosyltransferase SpsG